MTVINYESAVSDLRSKNRDATHHLILSTRKEVLPEHNHAADTACLEIERRHQHGYRQLFSVGIDTKGTLYYGIQLDVTEGENNSCAEQDVYDQVIRARRELAFIVTARYDREVKRSHIVPPCSNCRRDGIILFPNMDVLIVHKDELTRLAMVVGSPLLIDDRSSELPAVREYIGKFSLPSDELDGLLMERACSSLGFHVRRGHGRILTLAFDGNLNEFEGLRIDAAKVREGGSKPRKRHKRCSEVAAIAEAERAGALFDRVVTYEFQQNQPVLVPPGIRCAGRIAHFSPLSQIITSLFRDKNPHKVYAPALYPFPYKERRRPAGPDGEGGQEFSTLSHAA